MNKLNIKKAILPVFLLAFAASCNQSDRIKKVEVPDEKATITKMGEDYFATRLTEINGHKFTKITFPNRKYPCRDYVLEIVDLSAFPFQSDTSSMSEVDQMNHKPVVTGGYRMHAKYVREWHIPEGEDPPDCAKRYGHEDFRNASMLGIFELSVTKDGDQWKKRFWLHSLVYQNSPEDPAEPKALNAKEIEWVRANIDK